MNEKSLALLFLMPFLLGCTGGPPLKSMTQEVHRDGSSSVVIRFYTEELGDADSFNASKLFEDADFSEINETQWSEAMELFVRMGLDASDPDLRYPGPNPSNETIRRIAEKLSEKLIEMAYVTGMDLNCTGLLDFNLEDARCYFIKDDPPGENCALSCVDEEVAEGTYVPNRTFLETDYLTFPYITYRYDVLGTLAILLESDELNEWLTEQSESEEDVRGLINGILDVGEENATIMERAAARQASSMFMDVSSLFMAVVSGVPAAGEFTCAIEMPGTITSAGAGFIENNTAYVPLGQLMENPQSAYIVSRELNVLGIAGLAATLLIGALAIMKFRGRKPRRNKTRPKKK